MGSLNMFVGANGAGKSNLISFFKMLLSVMDGGLAGFVRESGGGKFAVGLTGYCGGYYI